MVTMALALGVTPAPLLMVMVLAPAARLIAPRISLAITPVVPLPRNWKRAPFIPHRCWVGEEPKPTEPCPPLVVGTAKDSPSKHAYEREGLPLSRRISFRRWFFPRGRRRGASPSWPVAARGRTPRDVLPGVCPSGRRDLCLLGGERSPAERCESPGCPRDGNPVALQRCLMKTALLILGLMALP